MSQPPTIPTTPTTPTPAPSGGGKKILIIVLVIVGVFLLICCGGLTTCFFVAKQAANSAQSSALAQLEQIQKNLEADLKKQQADAEKAAAEAAKNGTTPEAPAPVAAGDFPSDIKLYTPAKTILETSADKTSMITATTPSAVQTVYDFYNSQLTRNGWTRTQTGTYTGSRIATYSKANRTVTLSISTADKEALIQISHTTE